MTTDFAGRCARPFNTKGRPTRSAGLLLAASAVVMLGCAAMPVQAQDMRNIANEKGSREYGYGDTRGWVVASGWIGPKFSYCFAERVIDGEPMRIGFDNAQWQLAIPVPSKKDYEGSITVDGRNWYANGSSDGKWTFIWLDLRMVDSLRNGREVIIELGRASINKPLAGIAASITKVEECLQKRGMPPGGFAAAPAQPPAQPAPPPMQPVQPPAQQGYLVAPMVQPQPQPQDQQQHVAVPPPQQPQYAPVIPANPGQSQPMAAPQQPQYAPIIPANPGQGQPMAAPQPAPQPAPQRQAMAQPAPAARGVEELSPGVFRVERQLADGWAMHRFTSDRASRRPLQCMIFKMTGSEQGLRVGMDKATRTITFGLMGEATGTIKGNTRLTYWFDNDRTSGATENAFNFTELDQSEWLSVSKADNGPTGIEDALMNFQKVTFSYRAEGQQKTVSFPLKGSNLALKDLLECADH